MAELYLVEIHEIRRLLAILQDRANILNEAIRGFRDAMRNVDIPGSFRIEYNVNSGTDNGLALVTLQEIRDSLAITVLQMEVLSPMFHGLTHEAARTAEILRAVADAFLVGDIFPFQSRARRELRARSEADGKLQRPEERLGSEDHGSAWPAALVPPPLLSSSTTITEPRR